MADQGTRRGFRVPLRSAMMIVVAATLGFGALRSGSTACYRGLYGATLLSLLLTVVVARYGSPARAAFAFGFAVFGWGYVLTVSGLANGLIPGAGGLPVVQVGPLREVIEGLARLVMDRPEPVARDPVTPRMVQASWDFHAQLRAKEAIAHGLAVWVLGAVGGTIALSLSGRRAIGVRESSP